MQAHWIEWLNLALRWVHLIVGIAWIGASFYFVWLENHLDRRSPRPGLSGDLWAIHGGGIYHLEKYALAPPQMPETLHWFKWEAYFTLLTGLALLAVVFYLNPVVYLLAPGSELPGMAGVAIGIATLVGGWLIYHSLCNSPLGRRPALLAAVIFVGIGAAAYGLSQVFTGRGAFIHVGAMIGTIMVANVFFVIMPAQRALVAAATNNQTPDPAPPAKAMLRSRHNNYFTLPVLFIMISNHFPSTYGTAANWLIFMVLAALSILVRHYFNTRHQSQVWAWTLPAAAAGLLALAFVTAPSRSPVPEKEVIVVFGQVEAVIAAHCQACHAEEPTSPLFSAPPGGVSLETAAEIRAYAPRILAQAVDSQVMPLGNQTGMTEAERQLLGRWIRQGAIIP